MTTHAPSTPVGPGIDRPGLLWRWVRWTVAGEVVGFAAPAVVGAWTSSRPAAVAAPLLLAAGALEGLLLGAAQAHVLSSVLPRLDVRRFALLTSLGAVLAYVMGLLPSTLADRADAVPVWVVLSVALPAGTVLLLSIGVTQWLELRRHLTRAGWWIPATAGAWLAGLAVFLGVATPLWTPRQHLAVVVVIGLGAAVAMALTVGLCTGLALVHHTPLQVRATAGHRAPGRDRAAHAPDSGT